MKKAQKEIEALLNRLVSECRERGVQVAAYLNGELVVDAWAGIADAAAGRPVTQETLFPVFSTTKGIAATLIHLLVERGQLSYETRIAEVWPEFVSNGKEAVTVQQALDHTCGIPYMPEGITHAQLCDWQAMCDVVALLMPAWKPGTHYEYHAVTYGWIVGEVARRVDGRPFAQIMREEICEPLGITNMFVGIPDEVEPRVAILEEIFDESPKQPNPGEPQTVPALIMPLHEWMNRPDARRACLPASNGIMDARSIARLYAALLPGGVDGVELLPPERIRLATQFRKGFPHAGGYQFAGNPDLLGEVNQPAFGHGGYGGSNAFADPKSMLAVAVVKNLFSKNGAIQVILDELKKLLGIWQPQS